VFPLKDNIPTDRFPAVTLAIIVANVIVYFFLQKHVGTGLSWLNNVDNANVVRWGAIPFEFKHPGDHCTLAAGQAAIACGPHVHDGGPPTPVTAFSAMFMHGGLLHLGGNMLFLWIFGNNVEDVMGRLRFIVFYLLAGIAALALQILVTTGSGEAVPTLGASGAIAGVLGGYLLLWPRARVLTVIFIIIFFTLIEIPAVFVLGFWFLEQVLFGVYNLSDPTGGGGGVAYFAHIGGFVFGLATIKAFAQRVKQAPTSRFPVY
jgi:membrane associated rhomboid family serine protease